MDTKIFLKGYNSKKSVDTSEGLKVQLMGKRRLLPTNDVSEVLSQYDQYVEERGNCNKIRLTCQVNPICSNVLFNRISEIVRDEGSNDIAHINYNISNSTTVDDTGNLKYKPNTRDGNGGFWGSSNAKYQSVDSTLSMISDKVNTKLSTAVEASSQFYDSDGDMGVSCEHPTNAIRDMQLSNCGYVYHCGLDILNNHLLRSKTFKCVCKMPDNFNPEYGAFNTIADMMRDSNGNKVIEKILYPKEAGIKDDTKLVAFHLYKYDDLYTYNECIEKRLIKNYNGWVGFYNKPKIKTYLGDSDEENAEEEKELGIERPIMYMNGGDFVDMYPDRSLYSFVPKYNHFRNRIEKNWNYCLTYPSSSTTDGFEDIIETSNNSMKAIYFNENTRADNGVKQLVIYSIAKHGLSVGDYVNIYVNTKDDEGNTINTKIIDNAEVSAVVDEFIFTVFNADVQISSKWVTLSRNDYKNDFFVGITKYKVSEDRRYCYPTNDKNKRYYIVEGKYVNFDDDAQNISYKKVVNDIECEYYIRIFSKIPNFKNASADTSNEYQLYKNGGELIDTYQDHKYDFENHISRLAFARNIYSDDIGEIVFTDDINISNLHDNLGRPLTSVYLTIVKNNKGYKEWYGYDVGDDWRPYRITNENVEYSHCFGKITCGIKTSDESVCGVDIQAINQLTKSNGYDVSKLNGIRGYDDYVITNNEVWFDTDKHYYGDLCYYDNYNAIERSIQPIMHRFNTAQRESSGTKGGSYFEKYVYDEIYVDDYDTTDNFTIKSYLVDNANTKNEGYYYVPHYEIPIKTFDKIEMVTPDFLTMRSLVNVVDTENTYRITTLENHYLNIGDKTVIYDKVNNAYYYCTTIRGERDTNRTFTCRVYNENGDKVELLDLFYPCQLDEDDTGYTPTSDIKYYRLFKIDNLDVPSFAKILKDGTCRIIWRNVLNNGLNSLDKSVEEYPFTNGAFYVNKRVDLFLRRQDPYGYWGLYTDDVEGNPMDIENEDNYVKDKEIVC